MVFYFHGQGGSWPWTKWNTVSNDEGVIVVQPAGLPEQIGTRAWNTGLNDQGLKVANSTCYPQTEATCYDTCIQLNTCSQCAWATCADDGLFIEKLMEQMMDDFCIDTFSGVLANGPSNGSMFTYYLTSRFPNMFSAVVPVYGQPLINTLSVPDSLATVDIMHIHDRSDKTIPPSGVSEDGWIYMSVNTTLEEWARQKRCPIQMGFSNFTTPYSGGALNLECYHKPNCTLSQVFLCWWDGEHGSWDDNTEALALWFYRGKYRDYAPIELNKVLDIPSLRVRDDSN